MDSPIRHADSADAQFARVVEADPRAVAGLRNEFGQWIRAYLALEDERVSDVVLAVNEALANAAEFAYVTAPEAGTVSIEAHHSPGAARLVVVVSDRGVWYDEKPTERSRNRGRGIPLMHALSDGATIESRPEGTRVRLRFDDCAAVPNRPGAMSEA
jgi:anti-sigma regulatory factor (Ser/Thr protein kinase)